MAPGQAYARRLERIGEKTNIGIANRDPPRLHKCRVQLG